VATVNDIAQVLATGLGLRTGTVMQHVRAAMEDGFLPEVGESDAAGAVTTLLTVAISQLSESPDQTPNLVHQFSELPLAGVKVWKAGQIVEPVKPYDALVNLISSKTVAGYAAQSFEEYLHSDLPDARYCAGVSLGLMDGSPRVQVTVR